jgi:hypothetical protein
VWYKSGLLWALGGLQEGNTDTIEKPWPPGAISGIGVNKMLSYLTHYLRPLCGSFGSLNSSVLTPVGVVQQLSVKEDDNHRSYLPCLHLSLHYIIPMHLLMSFIFSHSLHDISICSLFAHMFQHLMYIKLTTVCIILCTFTVPLTPSMANLNHRMNI